MRAPSKRRQLTGLLGWLGISYLAAAIGAIASINAVDFYERLAQPEWAPPAAVFGPVWMTLYGLMGIAAWLIWRGRPRRKALNLFLIQLALNALWSWLYFVWHLGAVSFYSILVLWVLILCTLITFWRRKPLAGLLLGPYLLWVSLASALTLATWQLNPQILG
ncbi:TspO/MBR family protein [Kushneria phosphatilytica]|uniref:TspO/MBR family protein n=1 Tax=Kushneria phosphatilytica TaxID=657387 RepID=UPI0008DA8149|nr:TspO/MBR family protein [Kushneria phosphatilytica]OHV07551.1 sensory protein [Kushneria phosphatilytica]